MKPDAPDGIRGEFKPIDTKVPGVRICEHLPRAGRRRPTSWRSSGRCRTRHTNHLNATHQILTGHSQPGAFFDKIASRDDYPCYASAPRLPPPAARRRAQRRDAADLPDGRAARLAGPARRLPRPAARPLADQAGPEPRPTSGSRAWPCPSASASSGSSGVGTCSTRLDRPARRGSRPRPRRRPVRRPARPGLLAAALGQGRRGPSSSTARTRSVARPLRPAHVRPVAAAGAAAGRGRRADRPGRTWGACRPGTRTRATSSRSRTGSCRRPTRASRPCSTTWRDRPARRDARGRHRRVRPDAADRPEHGQRQRPGRPRPLGGGLLGRLRRRRGPRRPGDRPVRPDRRLPGEPRRTRPADLAATIYQALGIDPTTELRDRLDRPIRLATGEPIARLFTG